jgi:hypothetical protein
MGASFVCLGICVDVLGGGLNRVGLGEHDKKKLTAQIFSLIRISKFIYIKEEEEEEEEALFPLQ